MNMQLPSTRPITVFVATAQADQPTSRREAWVVG